MDLRWKHPFTAILSGPTMSGKSTFIKNFLLNLNEMVDTDIPDIMYCAPSISQMDLSQLGKNVRYYEGIPETEMFTDQKPRLVILDDMMREADDRVVDIFTKVKKLFLITLKMATYYKTILSFMMDHRALITVIIVWYVFRN